MNFETLILSVNRHRRLALSVVAALALPLGLFGTPANTQVALASPGIVECKEMETEMDSHAGIHHHHHCPPPPESGVRNGGGPGSLVSYYITETGEEQYYTNDGHKLAGIAIDDLKILASAPVGTAISFTAANGQSIAVSYQGNGLFNGTYNSGVFSFTSADVETYQQCSPGALTLAQARANALPTGMEQSIAQLILNAVSEACS